MGATTKGPRMRFVGLLRIDRKSSIKVLLCGESDDWVQMGKLQTGRYRHAVLTVGPQDLPCLAAGDIF